jgi:PRTRC genetic system protein E
VNVVPEKLKDGENAALTTPLTLTGTADELDRDLPVTLVDYVSARLQLRNTLDRAKAEMEAAAKAGQAEARTKSKTPNAKVSPKPEPVKDAESTRLVPQTSPEPPRTAGLFDSAEPESNPGAVEQEEIPADGSGDFGEDEEDADEAA